MTVATTIIEQMGGHGKIMAMTGTRQFLDHGDGVSFRFKNRAPAPNHVKIILDPSDTYTVTFGRIHGLNFKVTATFELVYWDGLKGLFEAQTGLYLSL